jgi:eukaryotic-like serine/threonine-protein kinase
VFQDCEEPRVFTPGEAFLQYPYVVESFLGAGASGQVYAAKHRFTGDRFAFKVGHLKDRGSAKKVARSLVEARATYCIQHHNVVRVFDLACEDDGLVWQRMELLDGSSVFELIKRFGPFSPLYAIDVAVEAAWGLQAAHELGIVHRDVQPSNLVITRAGHVKVLDFSMAKVASFGLVTTRGSGHGSHAIGTTPYMSPEHLRGGPATPQFDVFALGTTLWQMLAGRLPFEPHHDLMTLVRRQLAEEPEPLVTAARLPAYCDEVIRRAMAKDPRQRFEGMWPLARALRDLRERLAADPAVRAREPALWERRHPIARNPEGHDQYGPPRSLPRESPVPPVPSARIVVSPVATAPKPSGHDGGSAPKPPLAATVPMPAVDVPLPRVAPASRSLTAPVPTVRSRGRSRPRPLVAALVAAPVLVALGAGVWLLATASTPPAPPAEVRRQVAPASRTRR